MCDGGAILGTIITTTVTIETQKAQAKARIKQQKAANTNARVSQAQEQSALATRALQEAEAADARKLKVRDETERALATAQASASQANVEGLSTAQIARTLRVRGQEGINAVENNNDALQDQITAESLATQARARRRINSLPGVETEGSIIGRGVLSGLGQSASGLEGAISRHEAGRR